jgi:hypothetical protein
MRLRDGEQVSTLTGVVEQENGDAPEVGDGEELVAVEAAVDEPAEDEPADSDDETEPAA